MVVDTSVAERVAIEMVDNRLVLGIDGFFSDGCFTLFGEQCNSKQCQVAVRGEIQQALLDLAFLQSIPCLADIRFSYALSVGTAGQVTSLE